MIRFLTNQLYSYITHFESFRRKNLHFNSKMMQNGQKKEILVITYKFFDELDLFHK